MSQLGERLRHARESQGISLAQAAVETRILQQWLIALEDGAFDRLPNGVAARGFVRNYAQYLGLPADELIEMFRREQGASDPIRVVPASHPPRSRSYVLPSFFGVFFVTMALVGLAYVALNAVGRIGDQEAMISPVAATSVVSTPTPLPTDDTTDTGVIAAGPTVARLAATSTPRVSGAVMPSPVSAATPEPEPTPEAPIVVEVSIESGAGESWLRVQADGTTAYEQIMRGGEREVFQAQREIFIRSGNPTVVQVSVNGLQQGPLGQIPGQPVNWYWPPQ